MNAAIPLENTKNRKIYAVSGTPEGNYLLRHRCRFAAYEPLEEPPLLIALFPPPHLPLFAASFPLRLQMILRGYGAPPILEIRDKEYRDKSLERERTPAPPMDVIRMFFCLLTNCPNCKPTSLPSGRSTLSVFPSTWRLLAGHTRATPPPFGAG